MFYTYVKTKDTDATGKHVLDVIIQGNNKQDVRVKLHVCVSIIRCNNDTSCISLGAYKLNNMFRLCISNLISTTH